MDAVKLLSVPGIFTSRSRRSVRLIVYVVVFGMGQGAIGSRSPF
jgi:hypothetical protein